MSNSERELRNNEAKQIRDMMLTDGWQVVKRELEAFIKDGSESVLMASVTKIEALVLNESNRNRLSGVRQALDIIDSLSKDEIEPDGD